MSTSQSRNTAVSLAQGMVNAIWPYIGDKRGLIILAIGIALAGAALNWGWLVAAGVAPILLAVLPCAAMCALGLCMNKGGGKSCSSGDKTLAERANFKGGPDGGRKGRETMMRRRTVLPFITSLSTLEKGPDMKIQLKTLAVGVALIAGIISAPAVYADGTSKSPGSMMGQKGMMGQGGMMQGGQMMGGQTQPGQVMGDQTSPGMMQGGQGGQMGQNGMMGMMNMMGQMSQMMATCNQMMKSMMQHQQKKPQTPGQTPKKDRG